MGEATTEAAGTLASYELRVKERNAITGGHTVVVYDSHSALKCLGLVSHTRSSRSSIMHLIRLFHFQDQ